MTKSKSLFLSFGCIFTVIAVITLAVGFLFVPQSTPVALAQSDTEKITLDCDSDVFTCGNQYFVVDTFSFLSLQFDQLQNVSVTDGETDFDVDQSNNVDLSCITDDVTLFVTYSDGENTQTTQIQIYVGFFETSIQGIYAKQTNWRISSNQILSPSDDRLSPSSLKLLAVGLDYFSFTSRYIGYGDDMFETFGKVYYGATTIEVDGSSNSHAFVLSGGVDIIDIEYMPTDDSNPTRAELRLQNISTQTQYVNVTAQFNPTLGEIYYYSAAGEKINLSIGENQVPQYLASEIHAQANSSEGVNAKLYTMVMQGLISGSTFEFDIDFAGIDEVGSDIEFIEDIVITAQFLLSFGDLPSSTELSIRVGGTNRTYDVENGCALEFDYHNTIICAVTAPILGVGEGCTLYVDGELLADNISKQGNMYLYSYGLLESDHRFTFVYQKQDYKSQEFTYEIRIISQSDIHDDLVIRGAEVQISNDLNYPFAYSSAISKGHVAYVAGNSGEKNAISTLTFQVFESGLFTFSYYLDSSEYGCVLFSVSSPIELQLGWSLADAVQHYGIADAFTQGDNEFDKYHANCGTHGWRTKEVNVTVPDGESTYIYLAYIKNNPYDYYDDPTQDIFAVADVAHYVGTALYSGELSFEGSGSFAATVNGVELSSGDDVVVGAVVTLTAVPATGNVFYGWVVNGTIVSNETTYQMIITEDFSVQAVMQSENYFVCRDDYKFYQSLSQAIGENNDERSIYIINNLTITDDITIPEYVTVILTHSQSNLTGFELGTTSNAGESVSWNNPQKYLYLTMTIAEGVKLNINGKFIVGAVQHYPSQSAQGHTSGAYSQVINNGSIVLGGNAYLDVKGLIVGSGEIQANDNSTIRLPFVVNNYSGGTNTLGCYSNNHFPFVNYALMNIQCQYTMNYGTTLIGASSLFFYGAITTQDIVFACPQEMTFDDGVGSLFRISKDSSMTFTYEQKSVNLVQTGAYLKDSGVTTITINGTIQMGEFFIQMFGSNEMVLGLPYTFNYVVGANSKLLIPLDRQYMLLPGSIITVNEGGTLEIDGGLYVLDGLIQRDLAGKYYPRSNELTSNGFAACGMLYNNGTVNIMGSFAGIIQTQLQGATINVSNSAVLSKTLTFGNGKYDDAALTLTARLLGLYQGALSTIEQGVTYRSYALAEECDFVLNSFTMDYVQGYDQTTFALNQQLTGLFGIWDGEHTLVNRVLSIGTAQKGVVVTVNGVDYITNDFGEFTVLTAVKTPIEYKTKDVESTCQSVDEWLNLNTITIFAVKSVEFASDCVFEIVYNANGNIVQSLNVSAVLTSFSNETQVVVLLPQGLTNSYVQNVNFASARLTATLPHTVNITTRALACYIANANKMLTATADDLFLFATNSLQEYNSLTSNLTSEELAYVTSVVSTQLGNIESYKKLIKSYVPTNVTYGDDYATATAYTIDGSVIEIVVNNQHDYSVYQGNISSNFAYTSTFEPADGVSIEYTVVNIGLGIKPKTLVVNIQDKTSLYGEDFEDLTADVSGLVDGDAIDEIICLVKSSGDNAGTYTISAVKTENIKATYYSLQVTTGTYTIQPKSIDVTVSALNVPLSKANESAYISIDFGTHTALSAKFEIYSGEQLVAVVENGVLTLCSETPLTIGEYRVLACSLDNNYIFNQTNNSTYQVISNLDYDEDYYIIDWGFTQSTKVYDAQEFIPQVSVTIRDSGENVDFQLLINQSTSAQIKDAGSYLITVVIDGATFNTNFVVTRRTLTIEWANTQLTYNGKEQLPTATATNVIEGQEIIVTVGAEESINVGEKLAKASIKGKDESNYVLDESAQVQFVIMPMLVNVIVKNTYAVYGGVENEIEFSTEQVLPGGENIKSIVSVSREFGFNQGSYKIDCTCTNPNYILQANQAEYIIQPKPIRVLIDSKTTVYGEPLASLTAVCADELAYSDTADSVYSIQKDFGVAAGEYQIQGVCINSNYDITFVNAIYLVTPKVIELSVGDFSKVYGQAEPQLFATLNNGFELCFDDSLNDVVTIEREVGELVDNYKITAKVLDNTNYKVNKIVYTNPNNSVFTITKRAITIKLADSTTQDSATYQDVLNTINSALFQVVEGEIVDDVVIQPIVIFNGGGVVMTSQNFNDYYVTGEHIISLTCQSEQYDITIITGKLTVTKSKVTVVDMQTQFDYQQGDEIQVFDWQKNIQGNTKLADSKSFAVVITNASGEQIQSIVDCGEYNVKVVIQHTFAFEFTEDTQTDYVITVNKLDISDKLLIVGVAENQKVEYNPYPNSVFGDCLIEGVSVDSQIFSGDQQVFEAVEVGTYKLVVTVTDINYQGSKTFEWQVVKKDISKEIQVNGANELDTYELGDISLEFTLAAKYKSLKLLTSITDSEGTVVDAINQLGTYKITVTLNSNEHYVAEIQKTVKVIKNYAELINKVSNLLQSLEGQNWGAKSNTLQQVRDELHKINVEDRDFVNSNSKYAATIQQAEQAYAQMVNELVEVVKKAQSSAKHNLAVQILNILSIFAYFGIKQWM